MDQRAGQPRLEVIQRLIEPLGLPSTTCLAAALATSAINASNALAANIASVLMLGAEGVVPPSGPNMLARCRSRARVAPDADTATLGWIARLLVKLSGLHRRRARLDCPAPHQAVRPASSPG